MSGIFITATGTDIGKTYVASGLIRRFRRGGKPVDAIKPVATGFDPAQPETSDTGQLLAALGRPATPENIARISPWRFRAPLSPDLAAAREGRALDFDELVEFSNKVAGACVGTLVVEGIGGIMVPLDTRHTVLDWMCSLRIPLVLITGSYLGSLSHTLTSLEVLHQRGVSPRAVVVNESAGSTVSLADTISSLSRFSPRTPVIGLKRDDAATLEAALTEIVEMIS